MKNASFIIILLSCVLIGLYASDNRLVKNTNTKGNKDLLETYCQYSQFTDPGEYAYLYDELPESLPELCKLIRSQYIHPYGELNQYRDLIPEERWNEAFRYPTVQSILKGLISYDSSGLTSERKAEDRLVLGCRHNAILLASILKYRGIPARARYGHARYLIPDFHTSHIVCEVWNEKDKRWILVDPYLEMVDFSRDKFDFSNEAWLQMQNGELDPELYGIPRRYSGSVSIVAKVCGDLASILGSEFPVFQYPPILDFAFEEEKQLSAENIELLNRICELMKSIDAENLSKLQEIYNSNPEFHFTKSFQTDSKSSESK